MDKIEIQQNKTHNPGQIKNKPCSDGGRSSAGRAPNCGSDCHGFESRRVTPSLLK